MATEVTVVFTEYKPPWAPDYVTCRYTPLVRDPQMPDLIDEAQHIEMRCTRCGDERKQDCTTGVARNHIQAYCKAHMVCAARKEGP